MYERPGKFSYRVSEFGNGLLDALATEGKGEWIFTAVPQGTMATWTYTFKAKNGAAEVPFSAITHVFWRGYMDVCLDNSRRLLGERQK